MGTLGRLRQLARRLCQQCLVRRDHRLAVFERGQDRLSGRLDRTHQLDDDVDVLARHQLFDVRSVSISRGTPRSPDTLRTATPRNSSGAPMRAARSGAVCSMMRTTSLPTLPRPRTATPIGDVAGSAAPAALSDLLIGYPTSKLSRSSTVSPAQDQAGMPVAHGHHGGAADQVVPARHRIAVGAGGGHRKQVAGATSSGTQASRTTISPLSQCFPDDAGQRRRCAAARDTSRTSYWAPYSEVRMLSLMPPSTLMYRRTSPALIATSLTVPTS